MGDKPVKADPILPIEISQTELQLSAEKEVEENQLICEQCGEKFGNITHLEGHRATIYDFPGTELKKSQNVNKKEEFSSHPEEKINSDATVKYCSNNHTGINSSINDIISPI